MLSIHIIGNRDTIGGFGDTLGTMDTAGVEDGTPHDTKDTAQGDSGVRICIVL